ncbi:hypothetical protein BVY01_02745 [bacterium I07]|nr:hypothetical protein BVY01_02745 [bacterium I07]
MKEMKECNYCSETILATAIKCRYCGSTLSDLPVSTVDSDTHIRNALASRFEILEELGRGGMSIVYKAIQKNLNRPVALKVLPSQFTHDKEFLARFHLEAQSAAQLNHPNIVTIHDEGSESGVHFMAMEYIEGKDLHTLIQEQGPLSFKIAKKWIIQVAEALGSAHETGLVHRDIKSSNIIIDKKQRPVLTDFGIARAAESQGLTQTGTVIGTPEYMSPEQARGKHVDHLSDIYSLGVVLYECLTGSLPFQSESVLGTLHAITNDPPTPPRGIRKDLPEELENVVLKCLAKDPDKRYGSCEELGKALESGEKVAVVVQRKREEPRQPNQRRKEAPKPKAKEGLPGWWKAAIGIVGVMLVVVIVLMMSQRRPETEMASDSQKETVSRETTQRTPGQKSAGVDAVEGQIGNWLEEARGYLADNQLTTPAGANALETVNRILSLRPNHAEAKQLNQAIADKYESWGDARTRRGEYGKAADYYQKSLDVEYSQSVSQKVNDVKKRDVATSTLTDVDGNVYKTVKIGNQVWMAENLKVTHYRNGDPIPHVTSTTAWSNLSTGAYCNYDNSVSNVSTYGRLYNWYAVNDSRKIAPAGWHVPTDAEWRTVVDYLGGSGVAGGKMKESGTLHWKSPNTGATNSSSFSALPGGYRYNYGSFNDIGGTAAFWSSTEDSNYYAWYRLLSFNYSGVDRLGNNWQGGFSVRCVRDN